jgi:hypothetical protein
MRAVRAKSFADIEQAVSDLGPPADGCERLFRGQTAAYRAAPDAPPKIVPALARGTAESNYDSAWLVRLTHLLQEVEGKHTDAVPIEFALFWAPALIQHYGPGSFYVDVTYDLATALWFGLHEWHQRWLSFDVAMGDAAVYRRVQSAAWYTPYEFRSKSSPPVIFVFDVPVWDGMVIPNFGAVVNLVSGRVGDWLRANAKRLVVQHGALLHANPKLSGESDVASLARLVIELDEDFDQTTVPRLSRATTEVFPPPETDRVYATLLSLSGQIAFQPTRIEHPLGVPWYVDNAPDTWPADEVELSGAGDRANPAAVAIRSSTDAPWHNEVMRFVAHFQQPTPPWLYPDLASRAVRGDPTASMSLGERRFRLDQALPITLESLLYTSTSAAEPPEKSSWIESALPIGLPTELESRQADNVCVEFAPIDYMAANGGYYPNIPRAAWVVRSGSDYAVAVFRQAPSGIETFRDTFRYDAVTGSFVREELSDDDRPPAVRAMLRKSLFLVLALLRDLTDGFKPPPLYTFSIDGRGPAAKRFPASAVVAQRARLHKIARGRAFAPRLLNGKPYALGVTPEKEVLPADPREALAALSFLDSMRGAYVDVVGPIRDALRARSD